VSPGDDVVAAIVGVLEPHRDPVAAAPMAHYMKDRFEFLGVGAPERRRLVKESLRGVAVPDEATVHAVALACWERPEREYQYCGQEYLSAHIDRCQPRSTLPLVEHLIVTKSWWDTVDVLCRAGAGSLVRRDPALRPQMDRWLESGDLWLIRSAILHQERWGADLDFEWVAAACVCHAEHRDFFVRKAIGWVLRTYAHRSAETADQVRSLLASAPFSGLTKREALKRVAH